MTLIGEAESLGHDGMVGTACTIVNRAKANLKWLGGPRVRDVCLRQHQYDVWWPAEHNPDRERVLSVATQNPAYGPYLDATRTAQLAVSGTLPDTTNSAVSYFDSDQCAIPAWATGKNPCLIVGSRWYYDLSAIL